MNKEEIFNQIKKDYPNARWTSKTIIQISFQDLMLDPYNYGFVNAFFNGDKVILTDFANNHEIFEFKEDEYKSICGKHNIIWDDYYIECPYKSNEDIKRYKECLIELANINWKRKHS